ncbi:tetratricopeptide repeat protein [Hamadaea tsunoensis]|uniref:tetratricopeptide repeat protein n=1 Tax=Hamadaea tsunoensis TaxID=53368 RepID=UPI0004010567|nr:tetratricopeptide repeat protein [Hamadaea tsunoensis]
MPQQTHLPDIWAQARAFRDRGDLASARMLLEDTLDAATFQYGEDHPDILATALLLASLHRRGGDLPTARRVVEEALQAGSLRHDEAEPVMLRLSFELAGIADQLGNKHEARKHYGRVVTLGPAVPGLEDVVREAQSRLGSAAPVPAAPAASPGPGVLAVPPQAVPADPALPQRVPQDRPVMGAAAPSTVPEAPVSPAMSHAPLPSLPGPVRFAERPAEPMPEPVRAPARTPEVAAPSPVFTAPPSVIVERRGRGTMLLAVAAALVAVVAAGVVVMVLIGRGQQPSTGGDPRAAQSQVDHVPATDLAIGDHGDSITLRWSDPASGQAGFAVKMGATKESMKLVTGNLGGKPTFTITGLNAKYDYCFSVVTIYSATELLESQPVCTNRPGSSAK